MNKVRVGIVGSGFIAKIHASAINAIDNAELAAVCNRNVESARALADVYGCKVYADYDQMLADPEIDAIAVCLPSGLHAEYTIRAAKAKKHVICEKPMDTEIDRAEEMVRVCREEGIKLSIIMQHRFDEPMLLLKKAIKEGWMGKLVWGASRTIWHRDDAYYAPEWRGTWAVDGGGALMIQAIHYIDLLLSVMGDAKSVSAKCRTLTHPQIEVEDIGVANIEFENGAIGTIEGTTCSYPGLYAELCVFGEKGSMIIRNDYLTFYQFEDGPKSEYDAALNVEAANRLHKTMDIEDTSHRRQFEDFAAAIREDRDPEVTGEETLRSLKVIKAIYQASDEKQEIYF